jgi:hypothetical protein
MIRKSILITLILFIAYELFLRVVPTPPDTSQNDKSANIISAQDFLYNYSKKEVAEDTVIVGTSVSRKLITDSLGKHYINLAFNAWSSYDGLELIKRSRRKPACLLIETNYVKSQTLQPELVGNLDPVSYYPGKAFKSLHLRNQPVGLLVGLGKSLMAERIEALKEKKREDTGLYQFNMKINREIMHEPAPDSVLTQRFRALKSLVDGFKKENTEVIFFEVPIDPELEHMVSMQQVRDYFHTWFPPEQFRYIPPPVENTFTYSDGIHLSPASALAYTLYLKTALNKK